MCDQSIFSPTLPNYDNMHNEYLGLVSLGELYDIVSNNSSDSEEEISFAEIYCKIINLYTLKIGSNAHITILLSAISDTIKSIKNKENKFPLYKFLEKLFELINYFIIYKLIKASDSIDANELTSLKNNITIKWDECIKCLD